MVLAMAAQGQRPPRVDGTGKEPGSYGAWTVAFGMEPTLGTPFLLPRTLP